MTRLCNYRKVLVGLPVLAAAALAWQVSMAQRAFIFPVYWGGARGDTTQALGGQDRYLTHLSTDKPIYRPGETMHVRGVILHHSTRTPLPTNAQVHALIEFPGPKGDTVASGQVVSEHSVLGYAWTRSLASKRAGSTQSR